MNINYVEGDAITMALEASEPTILCHIVNNSGGWGRGFVVPLGERIPEAEAEYREWHRTGFCDVSVPFKLGETQYVKSTVNDNLFIANMCAQDGYDGIPVRYWAITECMKDVLALAGPRDTDIIMPRIGCGLGGGDWDKVTEAIELAFPRITVVDLPS